MIRFFLKNKKWIGYILYGIILLPVFLYILFPAATLRDYIQAGLQSRFPDLNVALQKVSLAFPVGLNLTGVECHIRNYPEQTLFSAKKIIVKPGIWSLFGKSPEYRFICDAYDGTITGRGSLQKNGQGALFSLSTEFDNIHINEKSPLPAFIRDRLEGILEGTVTYGGGDLFDPDGSGEAILTLSNGSFKFTKPILDINVIDLKEALLKADLKDQTLNISDLSLKGDDFLGHASGVISLKDPLEKSRLNLKGEIEPTAAFMKSSENADDAALLLKQVLKNGKLPFTVAGTVEKPAYKLE